MLHPHPIQKVVLLHKRGQPGELAHSRFTNCRHGHQRGICYLWFTPFAHQSSSPSYPAPASSYTIPISSTSTLPRATSQTHVPVRCQQTHFLAVLLQTRFLTFRRPHKKHLPCYTYRSNISNKAW